MSYDTMTKEELEVQIASETALIQQLEKSYPPFVEVNGDRFDRYRPENKSFCKHCEEVQDAYWRRRMCKSAIDALNMTEADGKKLMLSTASVY